MIKYQIDYQYLAKGSARPSDDGEVVGIKATGASGVVILPNVGDFVEINNSKVSGRLRHLSGRVKSRLFTYIRSGRTTVHCHVNVVVEQADEADWDALSKQ